MPQHPDRPDHNEHIPYDESPAARIENPYFFSESKEGGKGLNSYIEKRSLKRVEKERKGEESQEEYTSRMGRALDYTMGFLPKAAGSLYEFRQQNKAKESGERRRVDAEKLLPIVEFQNKIVSILSGLSPEDRYKYVKASRVALNEWFEKENIDKEIRSEMRTTFDGCEAVCGYMDKRKEELGENVSFFTDVYLDWKYGIDLVEFSPRENKEALDMRLVQNKSSFGSNEDVAKDQERHYSWVQNELLGMNDVLDRFSEVVEAEYNSEHQKDLRKVLADSFADSALAALEIKQGENEVGSESNKDRQFLENESELSRLAFALSFQEDGEKESTLGNIAEEIKNEESEDFINKIPISRIYSVFAVNDETPGNPALLYSEGRDGRNLFTGVEQSV